MVLKTGDAKTGAASDGDGDGDGGDKRLFNRDQGETEVMTGTGIVLSRVGRIYIGK